MRRHWDMKRYEVARFTLSADLLEEGDRVEVRCIAQVQDGVIVVRAASVRGPQMQATLHEVEGGELGVDA